MIAAYWEDVRRGVESRVSGSEAKFLEQHGTESVRSGFERAVAHEWELWTRTELPKFYEVVEESNERVIAEISPRGNWPFALTVPLHTTRVRLVASDVGWRVSGIFQACDICNRPIIAGESLQPQTSRSWSHSFLPGPPPLMPRAEPGKCDICRGSGILFGVPTSAFMRASGLERDRLACHRCRGSGRCLACRLEEIPGWQRVLSLAGVKEFTE
jgi:hypothetical protein